ncbi:mCG1484 [Mus musculus]|nr:mCG1484 [Mus musculus]
MLSKPHSGGHISCLRMKIRRNSEGNILAVIIANSESDVLSLTRQTVLAEVYTALDLTGPRF